jgi:hypothetical protein
MSTPAPFLLWRWLLLTIASSGRRVYNDIRNDTLILSLCDLLFFCSAPLRCFFNQRTILSLPPGLFVMFMSPGRELALQVQKCCRTL